MNQLQLVFLSQEMLYIPKMRSIQTLKKSTSLIFSYSFTFFIYLTKNYRVIVQGNFFVLCQRTKTSSSTFTCIGHFLTFKIINEKVIRNIMQFNSFFFYLTLSWNLVVCVIDSKDHCSFLQTNRNFHLLRSLWEFQWNAPISFDINHSTQGDFISIFSRIFSSITKFESKILDFFVGIQSKFTSQNHIIATYTSDNLRASDERNK